MWGWKICGTVVCLMVVAPCIRVGGQTMPVGARSISLAGISSGLEDAWAGMNNPAGLARYDNWSLGTSLEQRFLMKELGYYALCITAPLEKGSLGISVLFSGYQSFIDQKISIAYGRSFGGQVLAGLSLVYVYQKSGYETKPVHQVSYKLGTIILLSERFHLSFTTFNPFQIYFKNEPYATLPSVFSLGLSYHYNQALILYSELEKDLDFPVRYKMGIEYSIHEIFVLRGGISLFPSSYSFGAGLRHQRILIELASSYNQYLGFTPSVTFQYDIK